MNALRANKVTKKTCSARPILFPILFSSLFLLFTFTSNAQEVSVSIDTASISIGEQIRYEIVVNTGSSATVTFPEGQTFAPLEMVEAYKTDTSAVDSKLRWLKEYALTKFDSGTYVIPPQRVLINHREIVTDSFLVQVAGVVVDTTKQKMYPIKPSVEIPERFHLPKWLWWVLGGLIALIAMMYFLLRRKKKKDEAKQNIPPYEKAMLSLKQLDEGTLLADHEIKNYYSVLTDAARRYLDEKVDDRALESTTSELIVRLQMQKDSGRLHIDQQIIDDFERILKRADLAKFARSKPGVITAKEDRGNIEKIIHDTKEGIPEPTEEELQKDEAYRKKQIKKQKRKRIIAWSLSVAGILAIIIAVLITTKGMSFVKDVVLGNTTKELLQGEWITSEYGNPPITITTPEVLVRQQIEAPKKPLMTNVETFASGSLFSDYYVVLSTGKINKQAAPSAQGGIDPKKAMEEIFTHLGANGAQNIVIKQKEFNTAAGVEGNKITGSFSVKNKETGESVKKEYVLLTFSQNAGLQQVLLAFDKEDEYADKITSRIVYSVELNKIGN